MSEFLANWYFWIKALHIIFVVTWMVGIFYLPRLFVYHCRIEPGSDPDKMFQTMERKLFKVIMNPSMILVWIFGPLLVLAPQAGVDLGAIWVWVKFAAIVGLTGFHHVLGRWRKAFEAGENTRPEKFYRKANEIPAVLLVVIIIMVVVRPF